METIPRLGFGTYQIAPRDTEQLVGEALRAGYRHIDTARDYRNEAGVGAAVRASGLPRDDIWKATISVAFKTEDRFCTTIEQPFNRAHNAALAIGERGTPCSRPRSRPYKTSISALGRSVGSLPWLW